MQPAVLRLTTALEDLARVYHWLDEVTAGAAIPHRILSRMHIVLEEAVANAALHGFGPGITGEITVRVCIGPETVLLEVKDAGAPFDPATAPLPRRADCLANAVPGGWGIGLIRRLCPSMTYERRDGVNRLTMPFARAEPSHMVGFPEPASPR